MRFSEAGLKTSLDQSRVEVQTGPGLNPGLDPGPDPGPDPGQTSESINYSLILSQTAVSTEYT